jgi:hypothetical protein
MIAVAKAVSSSPVDNLIFQILVRLPIYPSLSPRPTLVLCYIPPTSPGLSFSLCPALSTSNPFRRVCVGACALFTMHMASNAFADAKSTAARIALCGYEMNIALRLRRLCGLPEGRENSRLAEEGEECLHSTSVAWRAQCWSEGPESWLSMLECRTGGYSRQER